ncbi:MAG TPA: cobalamin-dependent protein [Bacteroidales bacterium]|nr:cobalamin-dependent protein [Bacteroidales bacterium]
MEDSTTLYHPKHKIRIVTAASLYDGHDAAINIMRRIMQASGAEVIHLGHNRSVHEIVNCAVQEDVQAIAITSYQGGHMEYFKYMFDLLKEKNSGHIRIFGGGGGVILPHEIDELHTYGITRIYSPDDGRQMGLQGMINDLLRQSDFPSGRINDLNTQDIYHRDYASIARLVSAAENRDAGAEPLLAQLHSAGCGNPVPVLGITGTGGAGKSSIVDEITRRFLEAYPEKHLAILSVDPSKRKSGVPCSATASG